MIRIHLWLKKCTLMSVVRKWVEECIALRMLGMFLEDGGNIERSESYLVRCWPPCFDWDWPSWPSSKPAPPTGERSCTRCLTPICNPSPPSLCFVWEMPSFQVPNLHHTGCLLTAPPPLFRIKQANLSTKFFFSWTNLWKSTSLLPNMFLFFADIVEGLLQNTSY